MLVCYPVSRNGKLFFTYVLTFVNPFLTSFTLIVLHLAISCQIYLFFDNRIHLPSKEDKWRICDSLSEFNDKIVLNALAAQVSVTENLTVIWIADQVHSIVCVRHGAASNPKTDPTWHLILLGETQPRSSFKVGKMANAGENGSSSKREHSIRYDTCTQAWECSTSFRADLQKYNHWFFSIRKRTFS